MKLKKIASLMLAGIMAVSMLAGCKSGENTNDNEKPPVVDPVATGVAAGANGVISDYAVKTLGVSFEEDKALLDALTAASSEYKSKDIEDLVTAKGYEAAALSTKEAALVKKISKTMAGVESAYLNYNSNSTSAFNSLTAAGTKKLATVFTVGANYTAEQAGAMVGRYLCQAGGLMTSTFMAASNGTYNASYDADIAAVKVTSNDTSSKSMWLVAIVLTQTVVEAK